MEDSLISAIENSIEDFVSDLAVEERAIFNNVISLLKNLELKSGSIKRSVKNLRLIKNIQTEVDKVIYTNKYYKKVGDFTDMYDEIAKIQNSYYSSIVESFTVSQTVKEIQKQSIGWAELELRKNLPASVSSHISNVIKENIIGGGSYASLSEGLRADLISTKGNPSIYSRYAKTYATDAVNNYTAVYGAQMSNDLGLVWGKYVGSVIKTSRPFCRKLIEAKSSGMPYIHKSQIPVLLSGNINGSKVAINPKTSLPYGLKEGTNKDNFQVRRGGWGCGHQFIWVSSAIVPKELKEKLKKNNLQ